MASFGQCARFSIRIVPGSLSIRSPLRKKRAVKPSYLEDLPLLAALALS